LRLKRFYIKLLMCVIISFNTLQSFGVTLTRVICRHDGVIFKTDPDPITLEMPNVLWTINGGDIASSNMPTTNPVTFDNAGTFYTYKVSTFTSTGQTFYDTVIVIVKDWPITPFNFQKDTGYCNGTSFSLILKSSDFPGVKHEWSTGDTSKSITITTKGTYWLKATVNTIQKGYTCDSVYKEVTIDEYTSPTVDLGRDQLMCQSQLITLDAKGNTGDTYLWSPGNQTTRTIMVNLPGIYTVQITTPAPEKCTATDQVELIDSCPHLIFIPNAVSPNADLLNDVYDKVWNFTPKEYTFSIYNRWGELLFETNDMKKAWDCKVKDELVQQDVYVYKLVFLDTDMKWYTYRGTFFVAR
jgi:gliding motility-associated-like protein